MSVAALAGAVFGSVDAVTLTLIGRGIVWYLPVIVLAAYVAAGILVGGPIALFVSLLMPRAASHADDEAITARIRGVVSALVLGSVVTVMAERALHGHQSSFGHSLQWSSLAAGFVAFLIGVGLTTRRTHRPSTPGQFVWQVLCLALVCAFWQPVNALYQAPGFSLVSLIVNGLYFMLFAGVYAVGRWIPARPSPGSRLDSARACTLATLFVSVAGSAIVGAAHWALQPRPIERSYTVPSGALADLPAPRPNVVLIIMDTTRADHLTVYGYERNTSPNLARFASEAVVYTQAIAPSSWTLPSHASLFTGLMPSEHGAHLHPPAAPHTESIVRGLDNAYITLAEVLLAHGYNTSAIIGNTAVLTRELGFSQGFLYYDDRERYELASAEPRLVSPSLWLTRILQRHAHRDKCFTVGGWQFRYFWRDADELNRSTFAWLDGKKADAPFFLFTNYIDPHDPYRSHPEYDTRWNGPPAPTERQSVPAMAQNLPPAFDPHWRQQMNDYDAEIAFTDDHIGRLFGRLKADGYFNRSLIIVASDHGEAFGEHGTFGHNNSLYQEEIHVPLIVRYPGGQVRGRIDETVSLNSVMPMILSFLDIEPPTQLTNSQSATQCSVLSEVYLGDERDGIRDVDLTRAAYDAGVKTIRYGDHDPLIERFDLALDPFEVLNLANAMPTETGETVTWLEEWAAGAADRRLAPEPTDTVNQDVIRRLAGLGYLH